MEEIMNIALALLLQVVLITLNAVFACAEIAIISINEAKVEKMAEDGNKKAKKLLRLKSDPAKFLATIQVAITLAGFLGSAFAAENFSDPIVDLLIKAEIATAATREIFETAAVIVITLVLSYFTLVFGELVPKRLAMKKTESIALGLVGPLTVISKLFKFVVWMLTKSTNGILRLFGVDPNEDEEEVSEEDIRLMVETGSEQGSIDEQEQMMIQNVFEFDDLCVSDFAIHRMDVISLCKDDGVEKWDEVIRETYHSYFPIYSESIDDIEGVLSSKLYLRLEDKSLENVMEKAVKPPYFVPANLKADVLFKQMKETKNNFAVALDEYGGVMGIVTIKDVIEQIVGDFNSSDGESEQVEETVDFEQIGEDVWVVPGSLFIEEVNEKLDVKLPTDEYDTLGGLVFGAYGSVPVDGTQFEVDIMNVHAEVTEICDHRIEKMTLTVDRTAEPDEDDDENDD